MAGYSRTAGTSKESAVFGKVSNLRGKAASRKKELPSAAFKKGPVPGKKMPATIHK